jgi:hypothetical protein
VTTHTIALGAGDDVIVTGERLTASKVNSTKTRIRVKDNREPVPVPEPTPEPTPPTSTMPASEPAGWRRIFADDFTIPAAEGEFLAKYPDWGAYPTTYRDTSKNVGRPADLQGVYDPGIISVHDSLMDMHLRFKDFRWRVAAPYVKVARGSSLRIAVRFRADPVPGFKTAWLTWPLSETWPRDGELDFPEGSLNATISADMHRQGASSGSDQDVRNTTARYPDWHTALIEWVAGVSCAFYLDGQLLAPAITSRVPSTPMRHILQTETNISATPPPDGAQGHVLVDWITVGVKA